MGITRLIEDTFEVEGNLVISARDLDGSVLAVDIVDLNGRHYLVADNTKGEHLLRHAGKTVFAMGRLIEEQAMNILEVDQYSIGIS